MKMETIQTLRKILDSFMMSTPPRRSVRRKELLDAATEAKVPHARVYAILCERHRSFDEGRGQYSIVKMLNELKYREAKLNGEKVTRKDIRDAQRKPKVIASDSDCVNFAPVAPGENDIAEELSLMGTYL